MEPFQPGAGHGGPPPVPTVADIDVITATADLVARNLRITQAYHELAVALHARRPGHANWCTFATWASKQAGRTIRGEDLTHHVEAELGLADGQAAGAARAVALALRGLGARAELTVVLAHVRDAVDVRNALERASNAVSRGNLKVFAEIGRAFAQFLDTVPSDAKADSPELAAFLETFSTGEPPDGQTWLRRAFAAYVEAGAAPSPDARAELMLLANLAIGLHEQVRLQPEIAAALDPGLPAPDAIIGRLLTTLFKGGGWIVRLRLFWKRLVGGPTPLDVAVGALREDVRRRLRALLTEHLMSLELAAGRRLRLGQDLTAAFPPALARLEHPELIALLRRVDPTPDSTAQSGAEDWADLNERMHYIADLFRCFHTATDLHMLPFTSAQVDALKAGRRPAGPL